MTIGVPLYNGEATLRRCIDSLLAQTHSGIIIHIADDGSHDASREIARAIVAEHPAIRLTLQPRNLGPAGNFGFLLRAAATDYFMWLAADDWIAPTYVARMMAVLDARPDVVACVSRVRFSSNRGTRPAGGSYPLRRSVAHNLAIFLSHVDYNTRFYALYRRTALTEAFPPRHFHAYDWAASAGTLRFGKHEEVGETLMFREETPRLDYVKAIATDNRTWLGRLFPLLPLTRDLLCRQGIPLTPRVLAALFRVNVDWMFDHLLYRSRRLNRPVRLADRFWSRHLAWRLATRNPDDAPLD